MNRRAILAGGAAGTTALLAPAMIRAQSPPIRLGVAANESYGEPYFAADGGFFRRAGLEVELTAFTASAPMRDAVLANALDVGQTDITPIGNAFNHGIPLAFLAAGAAYNSAAPTTLLCVPAGSSIRSAADLAGQTIATISLQSLLTLSVQEWLSRSGVPPNAVKFFEVPFPAMVPAMARGTVAAALMVEPFLSIAKDQIRVLADTYAAIAGRFYTGAFFSSHAWIAANRPLVRRLAQALYAAAAWANTHHDETATILAKEIKIEPQRINAMTRSTFATELDPRLVQPVLDVSLKYGALERPVRAAQIIDTG